MCECVVVEELFAILDSLETSNILSSLSNTEYVIVEVDGYKKKKCKVIILAVYGGGEWL